MTNFITKSDIKKGFQCLKLAHQSRFNPTAQKEMDQYQQLLIERGNQVGTLAQEECSKTYNGKLLFETKDKFEDGTLKTELALKDSRLNALYEPTFVANDLIVRADILLKTNSTEYDLIEVKSGSDATDKDYILDLAIQAYVLKEVGVKLHKTYLWVINKYCELPDLTNLFLKVEIEEAEIKKYFPQIEAVVNALREVFKNKNKVPDVDIGDYCSKPYDCPFKHLCHKEKKIPELSIFNIPRIGGRAWKLYEEGIIDINDIDLKTLKFTENQARMIEYTQRNELYVEKEEVKKMLSEFVFPLYLIDFEAQDYDLPGFKNSRPGVHIPFQLSIKKLENPYSEIEEVAHFLQKDGHDPRRDLGEFLLKNIGASGSLVAYSQSYEAGKIKDIANEFEGDVKLKLENLVERLVDPLPIFRKYVYHPDFKGSYSIKKVGPALIGDEASYENLEIQDGTQAVVAFRKMITSQNPEEKELLYKSLISYCDKDTYVMGRLVQWLFDIVR